MVKYINPFFLFIPFTTPVICSVIAITNTGNNKYINSSFPRKHLQQGLQGNFLFHSFIILPLDRMRSLFSLSPFFWPLLYLLFVSTLRERIKITSFQYSSYSEFVYAFAVLLLFLSSLSIFQYYENFKTKYSLEKYFHDILLLQWYSTC